MPAETPTALFDAAFAHHRRGELARAQTLYEQVLARDPRHLNALHLRSVLAMQSGHLEMAVDLLERAIVIAPRNAAYHTNLGEAYRRLGRTENAIATLRQAVTIMPDLPEAQYNLGLVLQAEGHVREAVACYRRAAALKPDHAAIHASLAEALKSLDLVDQAIVANRRALALRPRDPSLHNALGVALKDQGRLDEALENFRTAISIDPGQVGAHSNLTYSLSFHPGYDARAIAEEAWRWRERHADPLVHMVPNDNDASLDRRLRIGYVSPDFRGHCQAFFTLPLLKNHDRENFEIFCYSNVPASDPVTDRIKSVADEWRHISTLNDGAAAALVREDRIDILVDLTMHMAENRLRLFAHKPAPVQVSWLAYPGTTGMTTIDYRISDPYLDPVDEPTSDYSEKTLRLPDTFWCYHPLTQEPEVNALPALRKRHVTFGCLNNFCKVNDAVLDLWARVLRNVDGSRFLLLAPRGEARRRVRDAFDAAGVDPARIAFVERMSRPEYLASYHGIDLCLDSVPYNGHTTSLDSFWMGVPVLTLLGRTIVGRAGLCQAMNLGLPELITTDEEQFVRRAVQLAADWPRLARLRASLRARMEQSPLMDAPRFARNLEAAYRSVWRTWCEGALKNTPDIAGRRDTGPA